METKIQRKDFQKENFKNERKTNRHLWGSVPQEITPARAVASAEQPRKKYRRQNSTGQARGFLKLHRDELLALFQIPSAAAMLWVQHRMHEHGTGKSWWSADAMLSEMPTMSKKIFFKWRGWLINHGWLVKVGERDSELGRFKVPEFKTVIGDLPIVENGIGPILESGIGTDSRNLVMDRYPKLPLEEDQEKQEEQENLGDGGTGSFGGGRARPLRGAAPPQEGPCAPPVAEKRETVVEKEKVDSHIDERERENSAKEKEKAVATAKPAEHHCSLHNRAEIVWSDEKQGFLCTYSEFAQSTCVVAQRLTEEREQDLLLEEMRAEDYDPDSVDEKFKTGDLIDDGLFGSFDEVEQESVKPPAEPRWCPVHRKPRQIVWQAEQQRFRCGWAGWGDWPCAEALRLNEELKAQNAVADAKSA